MAPTHAIHHARAATINRARCSSEAPHERGASSRLALLSLSPHRQQRKFVQHATTSDVKVSELPGGPDLIDLLIDEYTHCRLVTLAALA